MCANNERPNKPAEIAIVDESEVPSLARVHDQMMADIAAVYPAGSISKWLEERRATHDLRKLPAAKRQIDMEAAIESYRYHANRPLMIQQTQDREVVRRGIARFDMELADEAFQRQADANHQRNLEAMREVHVLSEAANDNDWARQKEGLELAESSQKSSFGRELIKLRGEHRLSEEAKSTDWSHRKEEIHIVGDLDLRRMVIEAVAQAMKQSSAQERIEATRLVNEEISRIRRDPDLTDDEKHLHIRSLVDTLPTLLKAGRSHDV